LATQVPEMIADTKAAARSPFYGHSQSQHDPGRTTKSRGPWPPAWTIHARQRTTAAAVDGYEKTRTPDRSWILLAAVVARTSPVGRTPVRASPGSFWICHDRLQTK